VNGKGGPSGPPFVVVGRSFDRPEVTLKIGLRRPMTAGMDERGFTMIELLVVVLVIAILAAIALPAFLGQADKARDANTKADVRNAVSQMEACFRSAERYSGCPDLEHPLAPGALATVTADGTSYLVAKTSQTGTTFTIQRLGRSHARTCTSPGAGGCRSDGSW